MDRIRDIPSRYLREHRMHIYHHHMTMAECALRMAWVFGSTAKQMADTDPEYAMEQDYNYAEQMARAIYHLTNARKIRKGV